MNENELIELMRDACDCFQYSDKEGYTLRLRAAEAAISALPERGELYGELMLLSSLSDMANPDIQIKKYREAARYISGRSRVLPTGSELYGMYYNPFGICNRKPGNAQKNAAKVAEAVKLFFPLTGGGRGTDVCYRAQLAFYRGELESAVQLATEAFDTSRWYGQGMSALCAAEILAQIAKHTRDKRLWRYAYSYIQATADESGLAPRHCREAAQVVYANLNLSLGLIKSMPDWIISGDFGVVSASRGYRIVGDKICAGTLSIAMLVQMQYYLYLGGPGGDPVRALNIADTAQLIYRQNDLITAIYYDFFRAGCYLLIGEEEELRRALRRAIERLLPDRLYLIATEFLPAFGDLIYDIAGELDRDAPAKIRAPGENYWDKLAPFREDVIRDAPPGFTRREAEVAVLIAAGKTTPEISAALSISERTVDNHTSNIFTKLNVSRKAHVAEALKRRHAIETAFWTKIN